MIRWFAILLCLSAPMAQAGAWPRAEGTGFVSLSQRLSWPQDLAALQTDDARQDYATLYAEYGVTDRLTLGLDLGRSVSGDDKSVLFVQYPLRAAPTGPKVTAQLGLGRIGDKTILRPGLSLGWGLERGWLSLDGVAEIATREKTTDYKLDITWGRSLSKDRKLILQVQTGFPTHGDAFVRLAPSMVFPVSDRLQAELGVTWDVSGDDRMGILVGLWRDF